MENLHIEKNTCSFGSIINTVHIYLSVVLTSVYLEKNIFNYANGGAITLNPMTDL